MYRLIIFGNGANMRVEFNSVQDAYRAGHAIMSGKYITSFVVNEVKVECGELREYEVDENGWVVPE